MAISDYLRQVLSLNNVCAVLDLAKLFGLEGLTNFCHSFPETFRKLSEDSICNLLLRDSFFAPEVQTFQAVNDRCKCNTDGRSIDNVVLKVRFSMKTLEQLLTMARSGSSAGAITEKTASTQLSYRRALWPEENVAGNEFSSDILNGDTLSYDMEKATLDQ